MKETLSKRPCKEIWCWQLIPHIVRASSHQDTELLYQTPESSPAIFGGAIRLSRLPKKQLHVRTSGGDSASILRKRKDWTRSSTFGTDRQSKQIHRQNLSKITTTETTETSSSSTVTTTTEQFYVIRSSTTSTRVRQHHSLRFNFHSTSQRHVYLQPVTLRRFARQP